MSNELRLEKMRYSNNSLSYSLGLLAILFSISAAFIILNSSAATNFTIFIKIILNILVLLFGFLSSEKVKTYSKTHSYVLCGLGAVNLLRIFWFPLRIIIGYTLFLDNTFVDPVTLARLYNEGTGDAEAKVKTMLSAVTYGFSKGFLPPNGYLRAAIGITLLVISAACFIGAGLVGLKRSTELANHLNTLEAKE